MLKATPPQRKTFQNVRFIVIFESIKQVANQTTKMCVYVFLKRPENGISENARHFSIRVRQAV